MNKVRLFILCAAIVVATAAVAQTPNYKLGRPATSEEIRRRDISVAPDGSGLPVGRGTVMQGRHDYQTLCANCHGDRGEGILEYPALVGGQGTLQSKNPVKTVGSYWPNATTVWDFIHRNMPYARPGSLTPDETYAVTAFILYLNGIVDEKAELNEKTLPRVKMPNRDGFVGDPRPDVPIRKIDK
jgi:S-disulfanyl-L-cysteine oxidoreductase SoxD